MSKQESSSVYSSDPVSSFFCNSGRAYETEVNTLLLYLSFMHFYYLPLHTNNVSTKPNTGLPFLVPQNKHVLLETHQKSPEHKAFVRFSLYT